MHQFCLRAKSNKIDANITQSECYFIDRHINQTYKLVTMTFKAVLYEEGTLRMALVSIKNDSSKEFLLDFFLNVVRSG